MVADLRKLKKLKPLVSFLTLLILLALLFSYAMFQGGFVSWFLFFSFLPFAMYSILLFFYPIKVQADRTITPRIYNAGDQVDVELTIIRKIPFPLLFLLIEDELPETLQQKEVKRIFFPGFKRNLKMSYIITDVPRGEHIYKSIRLKTGDALGLLEKEKHIRCELAILVYPPYEPVYSELFLSLADQGGIINGANHQNDASLIAGVREYIPGDRFSLIDWKATARSNELMTKEFEARESDDLVIILDLAPTRIFETLIKFTASIARSVIRNGGQTGLFLAGHKSLFITPEGGSKQENAIFYELAKVKSDSSRSIERYLGNQSLSDLSAVFMVVTARLSKQLIDAAEEFHRTNRMMIFLIKGGAEDILPEERTLAASAAGRGIIVHIVGEQNFRTAFLGVKQA